jgi:membrane-associated phospholipid phosphatase
MTGSIRAMFVSISLVVVSCLSGQIVLAQTSDLEAPIASPLSSQEPAPQNLSHASPFKTPNFFKATLTDFRNLSSKDTLAWLTIGALASTVTRPVDMTVTTQVSSAPSMETFRAGNIIGGKEFQFGAAMTALAVGTFTGNQRVSDVAGKVLRAQLLAHTVTGVIKKAAQRERPDGSDTRSFPSGHTSVSFASATVLQREFGWKVGIPSYAAASYVAMARIEKKKHFLSDVAFGAAIGILAGRTVTIGSGETRFAVSPVATPGGAAISFSLVGHNTP